MYAFEDFMNKQNLVGSMQVIDNSCWSTYYQIEKETLA